MTTTLRTTCKIGACEPYCGIEVDVDDGVMVAVRGDRTHPVSKGYLCVKGHHLLEYQNDPDRLLHPVRWIGWRRRSGSFWYSRRWWPLTHR